MVLKCARAFWNSRRFLIPTPGTNGDAMNTAFQAGDQRHWHFVCPRCRQLQPLKFEQLKWDTNDVTKPSGKWRFDALARIIRYQGAACGHKIQDTPCHDSLKMSPLGLDKNVPLWRTPRSGDGQWKDI